MKSIPNMISVARIFMAISLIIIKPFSLLFTVVYILCGVSDILDGYIARKYNLTSRRGQMLDSIADLIFLSIIFIVLIPIMEISLGMLLWIISIAIIRVVSIVIVFCKYHSFAILHTYSNKVTGLILFCFPLLYGNMNKLIVMCVICAIASLSAIEELLINMTSTELLCDVKGIFVK